MDIKELQSKFLDIDSTIGELQKAFDDMQTAEHADVVMPVDYDPEIKKRIIEQTPFTEFLRSQGCIAPTDKVKVGYKEKTNKTTSNWMYEDDEIVHATPSDFNEKIAIMKIIHYPISIGDLAQKAGEYDLFADEMNDGYIDIANNVDYTLLEGKEDNKDFKGVFNLINTNTINLGGDLLTKDDLTSAFQGIIDEGGYPTGIVCTSEVADQINDIYFPGTVKQLEYELVALRLQMIQQEAEKTPIVDGVACMETEGLSGKEVREVCNYLMEKAEIGVVLNRKEKDEEEFQYSIGSKEQDVRKISILLKEQLSGRGGGQPKMIQGTAVGTKAQVEKVLMDWREQRDD